MDMDIDRSANIAPEYDKTYSYVFCPLMLNCVWNLIKSHPDQRNATFKTSWYDLTCRLSNKNDR